MARLLQLSVAKVALPQLRFGISVLKYIRPFRFSSPDSSPFFPTRLCRPSLALRLRTAPPPPGPPLACASTGGCCPTADPAVVSSHCCDHGALLSSLVLVSRVTKTLAASHQYAPYLALHLRLSHLALESSHRLCTAGAPAGPMDFLKCFGV